jgi:hypothetical protein
MEPTDRTNPVGLIRPTQGPTGPAPVPLMEVKVAKAQEPINHLILSPAPWWFDTHWHPQADGKGRTLPHLIDAGFCDGCRLSLPIRAYAFLAAFHQELRKRCILQLTARGAMLSQSLQTFCGDLRGRRIRGWALRESVQKLQARTRYVVSAEKHEAGLPDDFPVPFYLLRLWGYSRFLRLWLECGNPPPWAQQPGLSNAPPFEGEPPV